MSEAATRPGPALTGRPRNRRERAKLELCAITRTFYQADQPLCVLREASVTANAGEMVALVGPSGAGKSTLLHIAGLLEHPNEGEVRIGSVACSQLSEGERTRLRRDSLGFVYQFHHLLPEFSALENVMLPQMIALRSRRRARLHAAELLEQVGLGQRLTHRPARLSGGEQQRVAIARALANAPQVLLADEPTGNLDPQTAEDVFGQLRAMVRETGLAALVATHNMELARTMDRALAMHEGKVVPAQL